MDTLGEPTTSISAPSPTDLLMDTPEYCQSDEDIVHHGTHAAIQPSDRSLQLQVDELKSRLSQYQTLADSQHEPIERPAQLQQDFDMTHITVRKKSRRRTTFATSQASQRHTLTEESDDSGEERPDGGVDPTIRYLTTALNTMAQQAQADRAQNTKAIASLTNAFNKQATIQTQKHESDRLTKYIPQVPAMSLREDVPEYLDLFEQTQTARGVPAGAWAQTLIPLLNSTCCDSILYIPAEVRLSYPDLKQVLLSTVSMDDKSAAKKFFTAHKMPNQS